MILTPGTLYRYHRRDCLIVILLPPVQQWTITMNQLSLTAGYARGQV
jgi:hypothetical protein